MTAKYMADRRVRPLGRRTYDRSVIDVTSADWADGFDAGYDSRGGLNLVGIIAVTLAGLFVGLTLGILFVSVVR